MILLRLHETIYYSGVNRIKENKKVYNFIKIIFLSGKYIKNLLTFAHSFK